MKMGYVLSALLLAASSLLHAQSLPVMEAVVGNNFGHLPMFVGVEKGLFKQHGVDVKLKVVNIGSQMVTSMQKNEVQIGDMSVTTFLKARHGGSPFLVVGMIMNDATNTFDVSGHYADLNIATLALGTTPGRTSNASAALFKFDTGVANINALTLSVGKITAGSVASNFTIGGGVPRNWGIVP